MLIIHDANLSDLAFRAAGFIADWILAHGEDGLGDRTRLKAKSCVLDGAGELVGVIAQVDDDRDRLVLLQ
jgi:hypothetical protein